MEVTQKHRHEIRVFSGSEDRQAMPGQPNGQAGQPQVKAEAQRGRQRAIDDGDRAGCAAQENGLGQCLMDGHLEAFNGM